MNNKYLISKLLVVISPWLFNTTSLANTIPELSITIGYHDTTSPEETRKIELRSPDDDIDVVITNNSNVPILLWESWNSWGHFNVVFEVFDENGSFLYYIERDKKRIAFTRNFPSTFVLYPNDSYVFEGEWASPWWKLPFYKGPDVYKLRMRAVYHSEADPNYPELNLWTGTIKSEIHTYHIEYFKPQNEIITR